MNQALLNQCVAELIVAFKPVVRAPKIGGLAIGLTVALDILFGRPLTGAAMNPARTFGPALARAHWRNHLVYRIGPMLGGVLAGLVYGRFLIKEKD